VNILATPRDKAPLEYFAEVKALMLENNRQDRERFNDMRRDKKNAAKDRAWYLLY
jgi:hypothetical protein